ncbi:acyl-CoA desaturase [Amycolatopsis sp.]|uniref:fatty acid desaturase family protein n=1 Tax=Amycolatopsis sp. TaxID=37632 RepID=UPI002C3F0778|nr:acyl-CoA desaturase [Amycolatopsis sp.]HVV14681.1 acyl-CoA desaturase [Amycolatopsis sp.]
MAQGTVAQAVDQERAGPAAAPRVRSDFSELVRAVRAAGLLDRRLARYGLRTALTLGFLAAVVAGVVLLGNSWFQLVPAVLLAFAFAQVAFLGHDAGHQAIFANRRHNDALGRTLGNVLIGLSYGWWVDTHSRHHANPNHEDRDPDIGDGVLAFTTAQAAKRNNAVSRFVVRRQAWLFFPLTLLEGISLHVDSVVAVSTGRNRSSRGGSRRVEALTLMLHAALFLTLLLLVMSPAKAIAFLGVNQAVWGLYMSCTFAPNHKGMPIIERGARLDFLRRQVLTSRDVRGGFFTDLALGGLNYQIEHHLFPNMPRPHLRHAQPIVRRFCAEHGISYSQTSLLRSYRQVLEHLHEVGAPLRATG